MTEQTTKRRPGRPRAENGERRDAFVGCALTARLRDEFLGACDELGVLPSHILRQSVESFLARARADKAGVAK